MVILWPDTLNDSLNSKVEFLNLLGLLTEPIVPVAFKVLLRFIFFKVFVGFVWHLPALTWKTPRPTIAHNYWILVLLLRFHCKYQFLLWISRGHLEGMSFENFKMCDVMEDIDDVLEHVLCANNEAVLRARMLSMKLSFKPQRGRYFYKI